MFRLLERYQTVIVIFAVIALPLLVYRANSIDPANANFLDRLVLAGTGPIHRGIGWVVGEVSDTWFAYVDVVQARKENGELRKRLLVSERKRDELAALAVENEHLRGLLVIKERNPKLVAVEANVIAAGTSPLARTIEIDRGSVDRVARGMVVISDAGLVGLVMRVGWTTSEVMLVADEKVTLAAQVVRTRARGRLRGTGLHPDYGLELSEVMRSDDVRPGDRVATSGLGGVYPKGIPIGEIREVKTPTGAQHRIAEVEPYVDFARLEQVMVLIEAPKEEPVVTPEPLRPPALRGTPMPVLPDAGFADADSGATDGPRLRVVRDAGVKDGGARDAEERDLGSVATSTSA